MRGIIYQYRGLSYANRDVELERLREQVALLQTSAKKDKELLYSKNEGLYHQRGPSPAPSHS